MENEKWQEIEEGNNNYLLSDCGNVYSKFYKRLIPVVCDPKSKHRKLVLQIASGQPYAFDLDLLLIKYFPEKYPKAIVIDLFGELWSFVSGYENLYSVSNYGRIKSHRPKGDFLLHQQSSRKGYLTVLFSVKGKYKKFNVHRLVGGAFVENKYLKPFINHLDGNPKNNHYSNLEWCTNAENAAHSKLLGRRPRGSKNHLSKLTESDVILMRKNYKRGMAKSIAEKHGMTVQYIRSIIKGNHWQHLKTQQ